MNNTKHYYSPKQGRLPVFISDILNICDPVLAFDRIMEEIEIDKYLKPEPFSRLGRPGYNKRVIQYFLENNMINRTKTGRLYNISFKLDQQTSAGEYGNGFNAAIKLEDFIDLNTGKWLET